MKFIAPVLVLFLYITALPQDAHAYLVPIIGAAGALIVLVLAIITGVASVIYLIRHHCKKLFCKKDKKAKKPTNKKTKNDDPAK